MDKSHQDGWKQFLKLCLSMEDAKALDLFFDLMLTPEEIDSVAMRASIIKELLTHEKTQRQIAQDLNVSIAKITRGSNELKRMKESFLKSLREKLVT